MSTKDPPPDANSSPFKDIQQSIFNNAEVGGNITTGDITQNFNIASDSYESRQRHALLVKVRGEVNNRLAKHLGNDAFINLAKELQDDQVRPNWDEDIGSNIQPLTPEESIADFFHREDVSGRFLILGEPGSGKTVTLLELTRVLLERAASSNKESLPLLLNLTEWSSSKYTIAEWLVNELSRRGVQKEIARRWIYYKQQIIPLLDGLDVLVPVEQRKCIIAINRLLNSSEAPNHLVICSRTSSYQRCRIQLSLTSAIHLKSLGSSQIQNRLVSTHSLELWQSVKNDQSILKIINTPLFLSQFILNVRGNSSFVREWQEFYCDKQEGYRHLFNCYIKHSLRKYNQKVQEPFAKQWLIYLATRLEREGGTEFLLEKMQPTWFQRRDQLVEYLFMNALMSGLLAVPPAGLIGALIEGRLSTDSTSQVTSFIYLPLHFTMQAKLIAAFVVLACVFFGILRSEIKPVETLQLPWSGVVEALRYTQWQERVLGALISNIRTSADEVKQLLTANFWLTSLIRGLTGYIVPMTAFVRRVIHRLHGGDLEIKERSFANKGIYRSALNSIFYSTIFATLGFLLGLLFQLPNSSEPHLLFNTGCIGGVLGSLSGFYSGLPCIQHLNLRLILWKTGYIPLNYVSFLNFATNNYRFLQRAGGGYRFVHPLLQKHFAQMSPK